MSISVGEFKTYFAQCLEDADQIWTEYRGREWALRNTELVYKLAVYMHHYRLIEETYNPRRMMNNE